MDRLGRFAFLVAAVVSWWVGYRRVVPAFQRAVGFEGWTDNADLAVVLGHWVAWQLPGVLVCLLVWAVGFRLGLMPSLWTMLGSGVSWRRTVVVGLQGTVVLLVITVGLGAAAGGTFGWHPYVPKMVGDLVSNLYEEIVHRGLILCAFYGAATGKTFPLRGPADRMGMVVAAVGSSIVFAAGHTQYPPPLLVVMSFIGLVFAWPFLASRSLWAPWILHTLGDVVGDSILKL